MLWQLIVPIDLLWEKWKLAISAVIGIFEFFLQKCLLSSPPCVIRLLSKSLNLIGCQGDIKGRFSKKIFKIRLRNRDEDEAETRHTCKGHCPLQKLCFYSGRIRTLVAMATYSFHRLIMGKIGNFYCLIGNNRILFFSFYVY